VILLQHIENRLLIPTVLSHFLFLNLLTKLRLFLFLNYHSLGNDLFFGLFDRRELEIRDHFLDGLVILELLFL
jgi:hypothetical protein